MPVSPDALNIATYQLMPKMEQFFFDAHPLLKMFIEGGVDKRPSGGEYAAFDVITDGPGTATRLASGSESYSYGRKNIVKQGRIYISTHIYSWSVDGQSLRKGSGTTAIESLLKMYPESANNDFRQDVVAQILTGNGATNGVEGFLTFNGGTSYTPDATALTGVFDFAAKGSQTSTVENLVKQAGASGVTGWYNQFGNVTSFASTGRRTMRDVYGACVIRGGAYGPPKLCLTDSVSFNNYFESLDDQVHYVEPPKGQEGFTIGKGLAFEDAVMYVEPSIDDNSSSYAHTTDGTMFFLNPQTWGILTLGQDSAMETKGFFELRGPYKLEGRDAWGWEIVCSWQPYCTYLKANGCLKGTALI